MCGVQDDCMDRGRNQSIIFLQGGVFINISPIVIEEEKLEKIARGFNCLMLQGKTWQAVQLISNVSSRGRLLNMDMLQVKFDFRSK